MSWSHSLDDKTVGQEANLVLEGRIAYSFDDFIPGVMPLSLGTHYLFADKPSLVRSDVVGRQIFNELAGLHFGFWTYIRDLAVSPGDIIRVSLVVHQNELGHLTLMPHPCSASSVVSARDGHSLLLDTMDKHAEFARTRIPDSEMPIRFRYYAHINRMNKIVRYATKGDFDSAISVWHQAWPGGDPQVKAEESPCPENGGVHCYHDTWHFTVRFVPQIAPSFDGEARVLARTSDRAPRQGNATNRAQREYIIFNEEVSWSKPGEEATSDEHDFVSVMAHEMGHGFGLGHLNSDELNVMYESIGSGEIHRTLQTPDIDFITNLYG